MTNKNATDEKAEIYLVGAAIHSDTDREEIFNNCPDIAFNNTGCIAILRAIRKIEAQGLTVSIDLLSELAHDGELKGHKATLATAACEGSPIEVKYYIDKVVKAHEVRALMRMAENVLASVAHPNPNPSKIRERADAELFDLGNVHTGTKLVRGTEGNKTFEGGCVGEWAQICVNRQRAGESTLEGTSTGFTKLDSILGGLADERLVVLGASTGIGKTEVLCQISANLIKARVPTLVFSMEMSVLEYLRRIDGILSQTFHAEIPKGNISDSQLKRIKKLGKQFSEGLGDNLFIYDDFNITPERMKTIARKATREHGIKVVIVDHLGLIKGATGASRYETTSNSSRQLKALAKECGVSVLVAAQVNREPFKGEKPRLPRKSDLRDSGCVEQDADQIIMVHREKDARDNFVDNRVKLVIAKNRHGFENVVEFTFDALTQQLREVSSKDIGKEFKDLIQNTYEDYEC